MVSEVEKIFLFLSLAFQFCSVFYIYLPSYCLSSLPLSLSLTLPLSSPWPGDKRLPSPPLSPSLLPNTYTPYPPPLHMKLTSTLPPPNLPLPSSKVTSDPLPRPL